MLWAQPFQHFVLRQELPEGPSVCPTPGTLPDAGWTLRNICKCMSERWSPRDSMSKGLGGWPQGTPSAARTGSSVICGVGGGCRLEGQQEGAGG